jgi:hypothetical protein
MPPTNTDALVADVIKKCRLLLGKSTTPVADTIRRSGYPYHLKYDGARDDN